MILVIVISRYGCVSNINTISSHNICSSSSNNSNSYNNNNSGIGNSTCLNGAIQGAVWFMLHIKNNTRFN